MALLEFSI